jgi:long-chain acyl-CoA synthetase
MPIPGNEIRLLDDDKNEVESGAVGELYVKSKLLVAGYHRDEAATADVLTGPWLRTGDLGSLDEDGFLTITGRKKDIIITSSGKNVAPANIEAALRERPLISQAVVYGDSRPYLVALLTLDPAALPDLVKRLGAAPSVAVLARDERVQQLLRTEVDAVNRRFARIEQVKRFAILDGELTQAAGELTPTLKVKRAAVYDIHGETLERLYRETAGVPAG